MLQGRKAERELLRRLWNISASQPRSGEHHRRESRPITLILAIIPTSLNIQIPARDHQTMPEEPARDATIDSKLQTSFDIGYRLRWRNLLGGREPASSQRSWPALVQGGWVARRARCASASFQPRNRWQNLEESWQITGISRFFALAAFLA